MRITINLPEDVHRIMYTTVDENGYESENRPVTMGMIERAEKDESEGDRGDT